MVDNILTLVLEGAKNTFPDACDGEYFLITINALMFEKLHMHETLQKLYDTTNERLFVS